MLAPELALVALVAVLGFGISVWWIRTRTRREPEYVIELEKLIHCRSCSALIPEGARKCAFCGAWQIREISRADGLVTNP